MVKFLLLCKDKSMSLELNKPKENTMSQLVIKRNPKQHDGSIKYPDDLIFYNYFKSDDGFIVYRELMVNGERKTERIFLPDTLVENMIPMLAKGNLLSE